MPKRSFFLKYYDYKTGLRFVIGEYGEGSFEVLHNQEKQDGDEEFKYYADILRLQARLKELYPNMRSGGITEGETWFAHLFQNLFMLSERVKRKYVKKAKKRFA